MKINGAMPSPKEQMYEQIVNGLQTQLFVIYSTIADKLAQNPPQPVDAEMEMAQQIAKELAKAQQNLNSARGSTPIATEEINKKDDDPKVNKKEKIDEIDDNNLVKFDLR